MYVQCVTDYFTLVYKEDIDIAKSLVSHMNNRTKPNIRVNTDISFPTKTFLLQYNDIFPTNTVTMEELSLFGYVPERTTNGIKPAKKMKQLRG